MELSQELYEEFLEFIGNRVVDPEVFPGTFRYQFKLFMYEKQLKQLKESK